MKTSDKNKQKILAFLLIALAVSVIYRVTHPFKQEQVDALTFDGKKHIKRTSDNTVDGFRTSPTDILLNLINTPLNHSGRVVKNIFTAVSSAHEGAGKAVNEIRKQDMATTDEVNPKDNGIDSAKKNGDELSNFKVFGMYENEQDKVIFLERGKDILALREGDIVDGKFKIQTISSKMVTITTKHSDRPLIIDMNGLENN